MRQLTTISALACIALAGPAAARATTPTTTDTATRRSIPNYLPCPGFQIHAEFDLDRTTTTFYDSDGTAIRMAQHVHADGTLSNPLTGKTLADSGDFKVIVDLITGQRTIDGKINAATAPGAGVVYQAVGRLAFDPDGAIFEAGPHDDADNDFGALCAYLADS
jgi:hypothetical protein